VGFVARALRSLNNGIAEEPLPPRLISLVERFENARKSHLQFSRVTPVGGRIPSVE
jgi:hypothetical protein